MASNDSSEASGFETESGLKVESDEDVSSLVTADSEKALSASVDRPTYKRAKSSNVEEKVEEEVEVEINEKNEVDEEITTEGRVGWEIYKYYMTSIGLGSVFIFVCVILINLSVLIGTQLWLERWGDSNAKDSGVTHSTLFFDVTSSGKIVNRFSHDINSVDLELPLHFTNMLFISTMSLSIFVFAIIATRWVLLIMLPLAVAYYWLGGFFLVSSRELKRLDLAARSPMYAHFGETLAGLVTIRAFDDADRLAIQATALLDQSQTTAYLTNMTNRWLQIMIDQLSTIILGFVCVMAVVQRGNSGEGYFGIILSQIGSLTNMMSRLFSTACQIQTAIVAVERIREYANLTPEAPDVIPDSKTDPAWPQSGAIELKDYSVRYREGLELVLKDINVTIQPGERIGIVGRTGAGKSSVTLALFRIIEAAQGSIVIDGIDISTLGLHELRSRLTIIPQEPFLFGDTIRLNLDPFGKYTDAEIWSALESASLKSYISTLSEGLST
ncbi:Multidrug resistance-associated protein 1, partial [Linnemannia elongata]